MPSQPRRRRDPASERIIPGADRIPPRALIDESHSESYSRSSNDYRQTNNYRRNDSTSSHTGRGSYEMSRGSSSRSHHESNWHSKDAERSYGHDYYRERREEYEVANTRPSESWPARTVPEPRFSEREWTQSQRYDAGYPTTTYPEQASSSSASWTATSNTHRDHRNGHQERWHSQESRGYGFKERRPPERTQSAPQRRDWINPEEPEVHVDPWSDRPVVDNRSWEPAPNWQPSASVRREWKDQDRYGTEVEPRASNGNHNASHRNYDNHTHSTHNTHNSQRDWRNDDGNLNNWSRRDSERAPLPSPSSRKHHRSHSRSRSRSPAESHYSRRSSRGRTKTPSPSPASKRRRRNSSSPSKSRNTFDGAHEPWMPRQSPAPVQSAEIPQHRNNASVYAREFSRESSVSAGKSPHPAHTPNADQHSYNRLPTSVSAPAAISPQVNLDTMHHEYSTWRNGVNSVNGTVPPVSSTPPAVFQRDVRRPPLEQHSSVVSMPPPTIIPVVPASRPPPELPRPTLAKPMTATRIIKNAGFKPIGQSSSSVKKFFPGDEEDMDISSDMSVIADAEPEHSAKPLNNHSVVHAEPEKVIPPEAPADDLPLPRLPSSPLAASRSSSVVMEEEPSESFVEPPPPAPIQTSKRRDQSEAPTPVHSRSELYAIVSQVGEGTFGKVYKAQNTVTKRHVALKRIRMESEKEGFPVTAMREIKLLQSLRHENVVRLYEMMVSNGSVYMVFEYLEHDLTGILSQTQFNFTDAHLKSLSHQMLAGLAYLHHKGVIHRDIKGSNILINNRGELKLADFGLARFYQKRRRTDYTNRVITLWYRPPELLFGATVYGAEVDMWSAGCIMLELFTKKPVFQGNDEIHQLDTIYKVIGTPTPERWPDVVSLPWYELVKPRDQVANHFREMFRKWMSQAALDLAERLLCYDPAERATAAQAMEAPYFNQEEPRAMAPTGLAKLHGEWHELESKRERAKKRKKE
ncbi:Pkinase-domain-containing protein [Favolaschia claudopus]|uniref:[RNA-polymerase]-subunit kinase n=1 Tax=Favolaschia claudopus TaxID=2862362 RepID=A0AAW0ECU3_9AGAR